jgi:hypothetical protein
LHWNLFVLIDSVTMTGFWGTSRMTMWRTTGTWSSAAPKRKHVRYYELLPQCSALSI